MVGLRMVGVQSMNIEVRLSSVLCSYILFGCNLLSKGCVGLC